MTDADERLGRAVVFRVQKFSTANGPGIRTVIFLKGCPLSCRWCPYPEGISYRPELLYYPDRCIGCHDCVEICPNAALSPADNHIAINRHFCQACGTCVLSCPSGALEIAGQPYSLDALLEIITQDRTFYQYSGGGVTFAGGEAASHSGFLRRLAGMCKELAIHTALETCLIHEWSTYQALRPHIDLWIVNLRMVEARLHKMGTGYGVWAVLENLRMLASTQADIWIRTPIIPGWTDSETNIRSVAEFLRDYAGVILRWELNAFSNSRRLYPTLGQVYVSESLPAVHPDRLNALADLARRICKGQIPVVTSGPTLVG